MSALANRPFYKMNGIGNKIIVLDLRGTGVTVAADEARAIGCAPGLAYDQLMVMYDPRQEGTAARMTIFNIDGSVSGACGNGTRCVAWVLMRDGAADHIVVESDAGRLDCWRESEWRFGVDMGPPALEWETIPLVGSGGETLHVDLPDPPEATADLPDFTAVNMGNPHAVFFVDDPEAFDLAAAGSAVEHHWLFPQKVNMSLAKVLSREEIRLRVWERGAGATLACGSAACATLVAAVRRGLSARRASVVLPGGELVIEWRGDDHVTMTGDVELEFEGQFAPEIFAAAGA